MRPFEVTHFSNIEELVLNELKDIAGIAHEANRCYREHIGEDAGPSWADADEALKASALAGVQALHKERNLSCAALHQRWLDHKVAEGWVYGPVKDAAAKTHPCIMAYEGLPAEQRTKDFIFRLIVLEHLFRSGL